MGYEKKPEEVSSLKEGRFVILDGAPCKIVSIQISKTGKHGHAKARIEGIGIVDGKKRIELHPSHDKVEVPIIDKNDAQVLNVTRDSAQVMDLKTYETFELKIPEEFKDKVKEGSQVVYWDVMGVKLMKELRG